MPHRKFHSDQTINHGLTLTMDCGSCKTPGFNLLEIPKPRSQGFIKLLVRRLTLSNASIWALKCTSCENEMEVPKDELPGVKTIHEAAQKVTKAELPEKEYFDILSNTSLPTLANKLVMQRV